MDASQVLVLPPQARSSLSKRVLDSRRSSQMRVESALYNCGEFYLAFPNRYGANHDIQTMKSKSRPCDCRLQKKIYPIILFLVLAIGLGFGAINAWFRPATAGQGRTATPSTGDKSALLPLAAEPRQETARQVANPLSRGEAGVQVYVDPITGEIGAPPPQAEGAARIALPQEELSTSTEGLVEVPLPGPHGGVKLDVKGRFQSQTAVSIDAHGNLSVQCDAGVASAKDSLRKTNSESLSGTNHSAGTQRGK